MESYFSRFKAELLEGAAFENLDDAQTEIFEFIEMYYNPISRHSSLGYISLMTFEKQTGLGQRKEGGQKEKKKQKKKNVLKYGKPYGFPTL